MKHNRTCTSRPTAGRAFAAAATIAALLAWSPATQAQSYYRCQTANGGWEVTDRPCTGVQGRLGAMGNTQAQQQPPVPIYGMATPRTVERAPDYLHLMSPACATMNDALRTGASRGAGWATLDELRYNYRRQCQGEEQAAYNEFRAQQRQLADQRQVQRESEQRARSDRQREAEQCQEMLRILVSKRRRMAELTPGQRDDLQQFDAAYKARCTTS